MSQTPKLNLRPERRLNMTFALQQALEVLQMPQQELALWLRAEIERNPLLEETESKKNTPSMQEVPFQPTLHDVLLRQIQENFSSPLQKSIAEALLEHLDERGFFTGHIEILALQFQRPANFIESVLHTMQTFDPPGIFARTLQETFLIQLKRQDKTTDPVYRLVQDSFEDLLHGRYALLKKKVDDLPSALKILAKLQPRPRSAFDPHFSSAIIPDLSIEKVDKRWALKLIEDELPSFHIQSEYLNLSIESTEEKRALAQFKTEANWIFRSLNRRRKLLRAIGHQLIQTQAAFLDQKGPLNPINSKSLAQKLQIHESTLSRALAGKFAATPRGILPLRSLITSSIAPQNGKELLEKLILSEDKDNPLTDEQLALNLKSLGFPVARRTIAKYRTQLKIGSASQRKHLH